MIDQRVHVCEVGPRDGLQNEAGTVPTASKIELVDALADAGLREIEVSSFVSPRWVPQLADAAEVFAAIDRREGVRYTALVPNERGLEGALAAGADGVAVFTAASESFTRANVNASIAETIERFRPVVERAHEASTRVRGYVSCVVSCPYEGAVAPGAVADVVERLLSIGIDEIDLGETIGVAVPRDIDALLDSIVPLVPARELVMHLHDTRGTALACAMRSIERGVRSFDTSCGGFGGCPYAPGAAGNLATEDLVYFCERSGLSTGVDLDALVTASKTLSKVLGRPPASRVSIASAASAD